MPILNVELSDAAAASLGVQARRHHRPLEDEARAVLEQALVRRRFRVGRRDRQGPPPAKARSGGEGSSTETTAVEELELPESYLRDLERATEILKEAGCAEIYLFGSLVNGRIHQHSDIDLAVRGCPKSGFFRVLGNLMMGLDHSVDLVDLDCDDLLVRHLEEAGELVQIG